MASPDFVAFMRNQLLGLQAGSPIAGWPIRADHLEAGDAPVEGGAGVILLKEAGAIKGKLMAVYKPARVMVRSYGVQGGDEQAATGLRAVSDLMHDRGPVTADGVTLLKAFDETGPQATKDPDTNWALAFGVFDLYLPTAQL